VNSEHQEAGVLPGYADSLDELQEILASLESEATDVDQLVDRVQRAAVLIGHCRSRLDDARLRIEQVVASLEPDADGS
jgi:exodeoxyribonuclease VII small subunit